MEIILLNDEMMYLLKQEMNISEENQQDFEQAIHLFVQLFDSHNFDFNHFLMSRFPNLYIEYQSNLKN